jgi:hypothetical protein
MKRHDDMDFYSTGQKGECDVHYNAIVLVEDIPELCHWSML